MPSIARWQDVIRRVRNAQGGIEPPEAARAVLVAFKTTGKRPPHGFFPCGLDYEDPKWPESWGPRLPTEVDWTGF